jgi:hypothetical protein
MTEFDNSLKTNIYIFFIKRKGDVISLAQCLIIADYTCLLIRVIALVPYPWRSKRQSQLVHTVWMLSNKSRSKVIYPSLSIFLCCKKTQHGVRTRYETRLQDSIANIA